MGFILSDCIAALKLFILHILSDKHQIIINNSTVTSRY